MDAILQRLHDKFEGATEGISADAWEIAPEGRWSCSKIVEHLGRSYGTTAKLLETSIDSRQRPQMPKPTWKQTAARVLICHVGYFPGGRKAPEMVQPTGLPGITALERALSSLERMAAAIDAAELIWGKGPIAPHFLLGPMTAEEWRRFHACHGLHHLRQLRSRAAYARRMVKEKKR
jgi:hypothetical protein